MPAEQQVSFRWSPIADYEHDPTSLSHNELRPLSAVWAEQRSALEHAEGLRTFNERLRREWAIETGLLERVYTLDRGVTQLMIEKGIDAALIPHQVRGQNPEHVVAIIRDHEEAIEGLFSFVKGDRALSESSVREMHAVLTRNQRTTTAIDSSGRTVQVELVRGAYKKWPNNPQRPDGMVHEYCPREQVSVEMERLIALGRQHSGVPPEVEAAWLHHRFTQIHPFQDGNGRVARCLATIVFIREGWFPLVISDTREERPRYISALETADHGDLSQLVSMFAAAQRKAFVQALGTSGQVLRLHRAERVIAATRNQLLAREQAQRHEWQMAKEIAQGLQAILVCRFEQIADSVNRETNQFFPDSTAFVDREDSGDGRGHYFRWQTVEVAQQLGYFANVTGYRSWARLVLRAGGQSEILVSFHGVGRDFRGLLAASACFFRREETGQGEREAVDLTPLATEIFQINYRESFESAEARFRDWLEDILVGGLELWRKSL